LHNSLLFESVTGLTVLRNIHSAEQSEQLCCIEIVSFLFSEKDTRFISLHLSDQ
jgi:hypothetical protein